MKYKISVIKDGKELAYEVITDPKEGDITAAITRVMRQARKIANPLWPCSIDIRHAD